MSIAPEDKRKAANAEADLARMYPHPEQIAVEPMPAGVPVLHEPTGIDPPPIPADVGHAVVAMVNKVELIKQLSRRKVEAQIKCENLGQMNTPVDGEARINAVIAFDLARLEYIEANRALEQALQS